MHATQHQRLDKPKSFGENRFFLRICQLNLAAGPGEYSSATHQIKLSLSFPPLISEYMSIYYYFISLQRPPPAANKGWGLQNEGKHRDIR